jgi:anti-sigma B factor antagonist
MGEDCADYKKQIGGITVLECTGKFLGGIDCEYLPQLFSDLVEQKNLKIVMDFTKVNHVNSSGVGVLLGGLTTIRNGEGDIKIVTPKISQFHSLLFITKIIEIVEVFDSLDEAVKSFE